MSIETEITRITNEVSTQTDLIGQIATALTNVVIPPAGSGGPSGEQSGDYTVTVYDYDGTVLAETKLNEGDVFTLPDAPSHDRLVFDGWSSTVDIVDNTVTVANNDVTIGAMYYTASGATEIDIVLTKVTGSTFTFNSVLTGMTSIDWGDGIEDSTATHTYSDYGEYTIKIYGMTAINNGSSSGGIVATANYTIVGVYFANIVTSIGQYAFTNCRSLHSVVFPNSITTINTYAFVSCRALTSVVFPSSITYIPSYIFSGSYNLQSVVIPNNVTSIDPYSFNNCRCLTNVVIPNNVTSIGTYAFANCYSLTSIVIPNGVTIIDQYTFNSCFTLTSVVLPRSITTVSTYSFNSCYDLMEYDFTAHTSVPTLKATNAFTNINGICQILVPASLYETWIAKSNWSTYANYIVAV